MRTYVVLQDYYLKDIGVWLKVGMVLRTGDLEPDVFPRLVMLGVLEQGPVE